MLVLSHINLLHIHVSTYVKNDCRSGFSYQQCLKEGLDFYLQLMLCQNNIITVFQTTNDLTSINTVCSSSK